MAKKSMNETEKKSYEIKVTAKRKAVTVRLHPYTIELLKALEGISGKNQTRIIETAIWFSNSSDGPFYDSSDAYTFFMDHYGKHVLSLKSELGEAFINQMKLESVPGGAEI